MHEIFFWYCWSCSFFNSVCARASDAEMSAPLSSYDDTHAIAGALKLFFRELPIPLITFDCYDLVLIAASEHTHTHTNMLM